MYDINILTSKTTEVSVRVLPIKNNRSFSFDYLSVQQPPITCFDLVTIIEYSGHVIDTVFAGVHTKF